MTDLGPDLQTMTQVDRELSDIAKRVLVRKSLVSEVYVARSIFHEIDEGEIVGVGRFGSAHESRIHPLTGLSVTKAKFDE